MGADPTEYVTAGEKPTLVEPVEPVEPAVELPVVVPPEAVPELEGPVPVEVPSGAPVLAVEEPRPVDDPTTDVPVDLDPLAELGVPPAPAP